MVLTALAPLADVTPTLPMRLFTMFQKRLLGSLYREGKLLLDETLARRNIRGVVIHDH